MDWISRLDSPNPVYYSQNAFHLGSVGKISGFISEN